MNEKRMYDVTIKPSTSISDSLRLKAIVGSMSSNKALLIDKTVANHGFDVSTHKMMASTFAILNDIILSVGTAIEEGNENGKDIKKRCYIVSATPDKRITKIEVNEDTEYHIDTYIFQANNQEELMKDEQFQKIYNLPEYHDANGFKGIAYGTDDLYSWKINYTNALDKVYHSVVTELDTDSVVIMDNIPTVDWSNKDYTNLVAETLKYSHLRHYNVELTDDNK